MKPKERKRNGTRLKIMIIEKRDKEVSHCWKNLHILCYVFVLIVSISATKSFGDVLYMFNNHCIFNATLNTILDINGTRWISSDSFEIVRWGQAGDCDFSLFLPVASTAVAGSLACFFAMCGRGGDTTRNLPQPWRIVPVSFIFNVIFVIISCVHVGYIFNGFSLFCENIHPIDKRSKIESCDDLWHSKVSGARGDYDLNVNIRASQISSVLSLVGWLMSLVVVVVRVTTHADFHILAKRVDPPPPPPSKSNSKKASKQTEKEPLIDSSDSTEFSTPLTSINY